MSPNLILGVTDHVLTLRWEWELLLLVLNSFLSLKLISKHPAIGATILSFSLLGLINGILYRYQWVLLIMLLFFQSYPLRLLYLTGLLLCRLWLVPLELPAAPLGAVEYIKRAEFMDSPVIFTAQPEWKSYLMKVKSSETKIVASEESFHHRIPWRPIDSLSLENAIKATQRQYSDVNAILYPNARTESPLPKNWERVYRDGEVTLIAKKGLTRK